MADANLVSTPTITDTVDQRFLVEPLGGANDIVTYLDPFPETLYNKAPDSRLVKLLYTLVGPAGVGWLRQNFLDARLIFEERGLQAFDLDKFYGNPLGFSRIVDEIHDEDPEGLIPRDQWDAIRARDAQYRNRVMDFFAACRLGNTPDGMCYAARSGLAHEVEIIENYRYLYDRHSDDMIGLDFWGQTFSTEEMIVLPRQDISQTEIQKIVITGAPTDGTFSLTFNGRSTGGIAFDADALIVQTALESLPDIGVGQVEVSGGPGPDSPWYVRFTGRLAGRNVPELGVDNALTGGTTPLVFTITTQGGVDSSEEVVNIPDINLYYMQQAIDRIKPVTTIPTVAAATGLRTRIPWSNVFAGSEYSEVLRYVTGNVDVHWPPLNSINWIELNTEHEAPRAPNSYQQHYQGWHSLVAAHAYIDSATDQPGFYDDPSIWDEPEFRSEHIGSFNSFQKSLYPFLAPNREIQYAADRIGADYPEPILVTSVANTQGTPTALVNGIYPIGYQGLSGVPPIRYKEDQFWASLERTEGTEYVELDLGSVQAINFIAFEISRKPIDIEIEYDLLDQYPRRSFAPVVYPNELPSVTAVQFDPTTSNPWQYIEINFTNAKGEIPFTRVVRLKLNRTSGPFVKPDGTFVPWSIEIRNLRVGRNVS